MLDLLKNGPPGLKPLAEYVMLSKWYNNLEPLDQENVGKIISETTFAAIFQMLCLLDGVSAIEDGPEKGELQLYYAKGSMKNLINDASHGEFLHDLIWPAIEDSK